jgi:putative transposase
MQIRNEKVPRARHLSRSGGELSRAAQRRLDWMSYYRNHGRNAALTCRHFAISRQTIYRWWRRFHPRDLASLEDLSHRPQHCRQPTWTSELAERVARLRQQFPRWGTDKLVVLLRNDGLRLSTPMVGRILAHLKRRGALYEPPRSVVARARRRRLRHRLWAIRKPKHWRIEQPGDLVELDTKELRPVRGVVLKHFSARDVISRGDVVRVQTRATALEFLDELAERMPFRIGALQVDGGSEFTAEFE